MIGAKSLLFITTILGSSFQNLVLQRTSSILCISSTGRLTGSLISMVCWAWLGGQLRVRMTRWQRGERHWLKRSRQSRAVLCRALWRGIMGEMMRGLFVHLLGRALRQALGRARLGFLRLLLFDLLFTLLMSVLHVWYIIPRDLLS